MQLRADSYLSAFSFLSTYVEYESWRCTAISELMINEQIRDKEVRLIGENGEQLGIMSAKDAYKMARDAELDLVKIAPAAKPPVCKIIDYGKYKYEKFIEKGNKVKVTLRFRGREMAHMNQTKYILDDFAEKLSDIAVVDKPSKVEGRSLVMFLTAKR